MQNLQIFSYEGSPIEFEVIDGKVFANATAMFKAGNTRLDNWKNSSNTYRYAKGVSQKLGIAENQLLVIRHGGLEPQGTWIHECLILNAARYISVEFELWCDEKLSELLRTGKTQLAPAFNLPDFTDPVAAARAWANAVEAGQKATQQLQQQAPRIAYLQNVIDSPDTINTTQLAKEFGMSAKALNQYLINDTTGQATIGIG